MHGMLSHEYWITRTASMLNQQTNQLRQHIELLMREYPELADDEFLRADMIEGTTDINEVLTSIVRMMDDARALRDGTKDRLAELKSRKERMEMRVEFGRHLILKILDAAHLHKVELPDATLSLRHNPPQLVGDPDPNELPDELVKIKREANKAKIREWLESGRDVPGVVLGNAAPTLLMRVK
jgi:hypothetical protein